MDSDMNDQPLPPTSPSPPPPSIPPQSTRKRGRPRKVISQEEREEITRLHSFYGARRIARRMNLSRLLVQEILREQGILPTLTSLNAETSKLASFHDQIVDRVQKGLTTTRTLREIAALGYTGGRTILADQVRKLRCELTVAPARPTTKRRFETGPAVEMQIDWRAEEILMAGRLVRVHALGCLLCYSRKLFLHFYRDERQSTLLEGLASAFQYFDGVAHRLVLDNMSTAVLAHIGPGRKPLWHETFRDFARHYGVDPFACRIRDPDRKGKKEKSFRLVWEDLVRGTDFASWDDLNARCAAWLDQTPNLGNLRVHGTTHRVPNQVWTDEERALLIRLPDARFPVYEAAVRVVDRDSTLSVRGTPYTVPAVLAGRSVAVRLFAEHFEVLDPHGHIAFSRTYVPDAEKGRLVIDPTHYASLPPREPGHGRADGGERLDEAFLRRFPDLAPLVDGLKFRMKTLAPIHIRALIRLCDTYGEEAFRAAAGRAQHYRRFDAGAVGRILEQQAQPLPEAEAIAPLAGRGPTILGEVEPPSFNAFAGLDQGPAFHAQHDDTRTSATQSAGDQKDEVGNGS